LTLGDKEISGLLDYDFCFSAEFVVSLLQSRKEENSLMAFNSEDCHNEQ
jgi:hypothetical protein